MNGSTTGFPEYEADTEETPVVLLVVSAAYVVVLLTFVLTLLTTKPRKKKGVKQGGASSNNTQSAPSTKLKLQGEGGGGVAASPKILPEEGDDEKEEGKRKSTRKLPDGKLKTSQSTAATPEQLLSYSNNNNSHAQGPGWGTGDEQSVDPTEGGVTTTTTAMSTVGGDSAGAAKAYSSGGDDEEEEGAELLSAAALKQRRRSDMKRSSSDDEDEDPQEQLQRKQKPRKPPSVSFRHKSHDNKSRRVVTEVELSTFLPSTGKEAAAVPAPAETTTTTLPQDWEATEPMPSAFLRGASTPNVAGPSATTTSSRRFGRKQKKGPLSSSEPGPQDLPRSSPAGESTSRLQSPVRSSQAALLRLSREEERDEVPTNNNVAFNDKHPHATTADDEQQHPPLPRPQGGEDTANFQFQRPLRSWDLMSSATMRFRHGHFSGRSVQRLVQQERHAQVLSGSGVPGGESSVSYGPGGTLSRQGSWNSRNSGMSHGRRSGNGRMSEVANELMELETVEGEAEFYRQRYIQKTAAQRQQFLQQQQQQTPGAGGGGGPNKHHHHTNRQLQINSGASLANFRRHNFRQTNSIGSGSVMSRTSSGRSRMPALSPDVLSPEDAADAFDPGVPLPERLPSEYGDDDDEEDGLLGGDSLSSSPCCARLLDLAEPDEEVRRILFLAAPSTLGAIAEPCFRLGMVAIISHFIDSDSMVAFVLVILFVRITTEELSGAISDAASSMLHQALSLGGDTGFLLAGKHMQMAVLMQLLLAIPILLAWALLMENVVDWLVPGNDRVGRLAAEYTRIIVVDYALQAASRTFMLVFHMTGQAQFELHVDLIATAVTIAAIALTATLAEEPSLTWIAWVQVVIGAIKIFTKVGIVVFKGLLQSYRKGFLGSCALSDRQAAWAFIATIMPLLIGSLIELREWEILVLFIQHLGGAEVAAWALMGILWEIFEASTEGLGEAAAVRVSLVLSENLPDLARQLAHRSVLLGIVLSLMVTSAFLLVGRNLSVALTKDLTLQTLFNDLVGTTGLANIAMSLAQVYWSLLGSQGRFGVASSSILLCRWLVTMPLAAGFIFRADYDLRAVGSALALGYMTSTLLLAIRLFQSDWKVYAQLAQDEAMFGDDDDDEDVALLDGNVDDDMNNHPAKTGDLYNDEEYDDDDEEDDEDDYFDESSSDSSTGFG